MNTALFFLFSVVVLLIKIPSTYAGITHRTVLPPGATGTTETVKILPNGTAVTETAARMNYTQMLVGGRLNLYYSVNK